MGQVLISHRTTYPFNLFPAHAGHARGEDPQVCLNLLSMLISPQAFKQINRTPAEHRRIIF
jgi:hypothetical protein